MTEKANNEYLREVAAQLARHDATLTAHSVAVQGIRGAIEALSGDLRDLREVLHGDGKNTSGIVSDLRDAGRSVIWMRRLAWAAGVQTIAIIGGMLLLIIKLGIPGAP